MDYWKLDIFECPKNVQFELHKTFENEKKIFFMVTKFSLTDFFVTIKKFFGNFCQNREFSDRMGG